MAASPPTVRRRTTAMPDTLSPAEARRIALAAQGFGQRGRGRAAVAGWPRIGPVVARMGLLQLDSVNVLVRSHYMPAFSRLGAYDRAALDTRAFGPGRRRRALFEYWAHEASLLPLALQPLLRWRMARARRGEGVWKSFAQFAGERHAFLDAVLAEIRDRGPLAAREITNGGKRRGPWWGRSEGKMALECLFWWGDLTTATRRGFERVYDLPDRVLPAAVLDQPTPPEADAQRALVQLAARAHGIAAETDLRDYYRLPVAATKRAVAELVEAGALAPVQVPGWRQLAYLDPAAHLPRCVRGAALVSPFDPLVWERQRTERLFGFRYRIEIYVPAPKRQHGYYVLPFLLDEALVARVDLKADRPVATLRVLAAHGEAAEPDAKVTAALAAELRLLADWLGLERIAVGRRGDLVRALRAEVRHQGSGIR